MKHSTHTPTGRLFGFPNELINAASSVGHDSIAALTKSLRTAGHSSIANRLNKVNITCATLRHLTNPALDMLRDDILAALNALDTQSPPIQAPDIDPWATDARARGCFREPPYASVGEHIQELENQTSQNQVLVGLRDDRRLRQRRNAAAGMTATPHEVAEHKKDVDRARFSGGPQNFCLSDAPPTGSEARFLQVRFDCNPHVVEYAPDLAPQVNDATAEEPPSAPSLQRSTSWAMTRSTASKSSDGT